MKLPEIKIIRLNVTPDNDMPIDVYINDEPRFSMENKEERIIKMPNGKHKMTVKYNCLLGFKNFEIDNNGKIFLVNIGPAVKINEA